MPDHDRGPPQDLATPPQQQFIALLLPAIQAAREGNLDTFEFTIEGSPPGDTTPYTLTITGSLLPGPDPDERLNGLQADVSVDHDGTFTHTYNFGFDIPGPETAVLTITAEFDFI